jgi:adenine-specific DNA-methyltransferase
MPNANEPLLIWQGKEAEPQIEPCVLVENSEKSYGDKNSGNLLIHGDNLAVLKALDADFAKKVKCAYIDPPYNTGATFAHYDDSVGHGQWLSMMKPRLELIRSLLKPDGVITVQIGFDEMAYLKVLMDEVYGRNHCIGQIAVRMSHSAGMKRRAVDRRFIKNTEYILMYYNEEPPKLQPLYEVCEEYPVNYYQYISVFPQENNGKGRYINLIDVLYEKFKAEFDAYSLKRTNVSIKFLYSECANVRQFILQNKHRVVRKDSNVPGVDASSLSGLSENEFIDCITQNEHYSIGLNASCNPYQLYSIAAKVKSMESGEEALTNLVGDWWGSFYKDMSRVDIEGGVKMKTSKKPERLIEWILTSVTSENDIILDAFLGSGTTAAVAMKMRRKFIGIEMGDQCLSLCLPRLRRVVDGTDTQGISKAQFWRGGSGFTFLTGCAGAVRGAELI